MGRTDRIEKQVVLDASPEQVWDAVGDAQRFGAWFGVRFDGDFVQGARLKGTVVPTTMDPEIAESQKAMEGVTFDVQVERVVAKHLLSFRWNPVSNELDADPSRGMSTLVTFELAEVPDGTRLTISETGFDGIPIDVRSEAFKRNDEGWTAQTTLIEKYLASVTEA